MGDRMSGGEQRWSSEKWKKETDPRRQSGAGDVAEIRPPKTKGALNFGKRVGINVATLFGRKGDGAATPPPRKATTILTPPAIVCLMTPFTFDNCDSCFFFVSVYVFFWGYLSDRYGRTLECFPVFNWRYRILGSALYTQMNFSPIVFTTYSRKDWWIWKGRSDFIAAREERNFRNVRLRSTLLIYLG